MKKKGAARMAMSNAEFRASGTVRSIDDFADRTLRRVVGNLPRLNARLLAAVDRGLAISEDTGELRGSVSEVRGESGPRDWVVGVAAAAEHAPHVEYGTDRMNAQPYLRPALEEISRSAADVLSR